MCSPSVSNENLISGDYAAPSGRRRKKFEFVRHRSTNDCIANIDDGRYPSLEKDYVLRDSVRSAFIQADVFYNKANRRDVPTSNSPNGIDTIQTVRKWVRRKAADMSDDLRQEFDDACKNNNWVIIQRIYGELVVKAYENHQTDQDNLSAGNLASISTKVEASATTHESEYKEGIPTYCGEISYLVYTLLCRQGVNPEIMRVICFTENNPDNPDFANNHALIIYSSDPNLFTNMEFYCGINEGTPNSYSLFIDFCAEINEKKETFLILDPWSKDNKIIDPLIKDEVFDVIKNNFPDEDEKTIKKRFLKQIIDGILVESEVLAESYDESNFSTRQGASVHIDVPMS
ncbi:hypothetical protein SK355_06975 [Candidatus Fukatsuia symbiotica]|uniref:Uncharacterized protein n=1 Tax=Candidatus Fukatsuia symbiotica TaxID=1878942 RepID=A0A2U8I9H6_9GAMM|nr:hypothetical protein [Candidatus Fukatsuia symbiotica]AWK14694.1 hypothetical protein CCS41_09720 [Candidatus Fukatsuia symbiotica]MEA9445018.1 hypothetical protein [Candidatus Fukatsuia symbiotica]